MCKILLVQQADYGDCFVTVSDSPKFYLAKNFVFYKKTIFNSAGNGPSVDLRSFFA